MTALFRYTLVEQLHSQRYLAPVLLYLAVLAVGAANGSGPLVPVYALVTAAVFVCCVWITVALIGGEDPIQRSITVVSAGSAVRVLGANTAVAASWGVLLTAVGLGFPFVTGGYIVSGAAVLLGAVAALAGLALGVAVGLICSRLVVPRFGFSLIAALVLVPAVLLGRGVSPVNTILVELSGERSAQELLGGVGVLTAISVLLLAISMAATHWISLRRS